MAEFVAGARVSLAWVPAGQGTVTGSDMPGSVLVAWDAEPGVVYAELVADLAAVPCHVCGKRRGEAHTRVTRAAHADHFAAHGGAGMCAGA